MASINPLEPYYYSEYPISNTEKGKCGENAFKEALFDYPVLMNVTYGKRQNDVDHLVVTSDSVIMNECKNTSKNFFMWYSWFSSHVIDRFADGLPIAQYYAHTFGYAIKSIIFTLTIPQLKAEPLVKKVLQSLGIQLIETGSQVLEQEGKKKWYSPVRRQIMSVINTTIEYSNIILVSTKTTINTLNRMQNRILPRKQQQEKANSGQNKPPTVILEGKRDNSLDFSAMPLPRSRSSLQTDPWEGKEVNHYSIRGMFSHILHLFLPP